MSAMIFSFVFGFSLALVYERATAAHGNGLGITPWACMAVFTGAYIVVGIFVQ
jgi:hypothetical protein